MRSEPDPTFTAGATDPQVFDLVSERGAGKNRPMAADRVAQVRMRRKTYPINANEAAPTDLRMTPPAGPVLLNR